MKSWRYKIKEYSFAVKTEGMKDKGFFWSWRSILMLPVFKRKKIYRREKKKKQMNNTLLYFTHFYSV